MSMCVCVSAFMCIDVIFGISKLRRGRKERFVTFIAETSAIWVDRL